MASRLVVLRQRLAKTIHSALGRFGEIVTPALAERFEPFLAEGEAPFDVSALHSVLLRMAEASFEDMVAADKAHLDELALAIEPRRERDRSVEAVRQKLIEVRRIVQGLFGPERAVEVVAIDGVTARQPELLWRQGEHTVSRLRAPDFQPPEATTAAVAFDPVQLADELEPMIDALRDAIDAVELERRAAAASQQLKRDAMTEHDQLIAASGRILSGFYLLARRPDLAERIRLSLPRGRTPNGDDPSGDASPDGGSNDEPPVTPDTEPADGGEPVAVP